MSKGHPDKIAKFTQIIVNLCKESPDETNKIIDDSFSRMLDFLYDECTAFGVRSVRSITFSDAKDQQGKPKGTRLMVVRAETIEGENVVKFQEADRPSVAMANWFLSASGAEFGWRPDKPKDATNRPSSIFDAVSGDKPER